MVPSASVWATLPWSACSMLCLESKRHANKPLVALPASHVCVSAAFATCAQSVDERCGVGTAWGRHGLSSLAPTVGAPEWGGAPGWVGTPPAPSVPGRGGFTTLCPGPLALAWSGLLARALSHSFHRRTSCVHWLLAEGKIHNTWQGMRIYGRRTGWTALQPSDGSSAGHRARHGGAPHTDSAVGAL